MISDGLARVRLRFLGELQNQHARLTLMRDDLDHSRSAFLEIAKICHKIAGTAATLGFPELGAQAATVDEIGLRLSRTETAPNDAAMQAVDRFLATARDVLENSA